MYVYTIADENEECFKKQQKNPCTTIYQKKQVKVEDGITDTIVNYMYERNSLIQITFVTKQWEIF